MKKERYVKSIWIAAAAVLSLLTVFGIVKSLFVSLDVDESYAVALAYRLVTGDKIMYDLWEPHQFSAFLAAIALWPFYKLSGNADYCVLYLRIIGTLIHLAVGAFIFFVSKKELSFKAAFLIAVVHLNFLPKWICMPEFELMHYWSMVLIFLLFYLAEQKEKKILYFLAGILYAFSGLCYPTMVLVFPFFALGLFKRKRASGILPFSLAAALVTVFTAVKILINVPVSELPFFVSYILMDSSHTSAGFDYKAGVYSSQLLEEGIQTGIAFAIAALVSAILLFVSKSVFKKKINAYKFFVSSVSITALILSAETLYEYVFGNGNQFCMQVRIPVLVILFVIISIKEYEKYGAFLWYGIIPSLAAFPSVLLITNMDINTLYTKLFPAVIAGLFILGQKYEKESEESILDKIAAVSGAAGILACIFACRIVLVRVNGCLPVTVRADFDRVEKGPAAGIYILSDQAKAWNSSYDELKSMIDGKKNVLYIGQEQLFYVTFCEKVNVPSVQGTTVFNEMYSRYYETFPEKQPEIIVRDASFDVNPAYYYSDENEYIFNWITDNYRTEENKNNGFYEVIYIKKK